MRRLASLLAAVTLSAAFPLVDGGDDRVCAAEPAPAIKALFLGDQGHHRPAERARQLIPVMAGRGIEIVYTENVAELNPDNLRRYDALILYANIDRIEPREEKALLDYVAGGGGFVPLHCASYCFRNSAQVVALIGAQFQHHGTGVFETKVVDAEHPIMQGLEPFSTWDETYVHEKHNEQNRRVLQVRAEGDREEPWTWVRTHGKGRVFYTAYGHDGRTWSQPGFHALVERGIRWAAGKGEVFDSNYRPAADVKPFEYAKARLPNYLPKQKWGTQGKPIETMQAPISPDESMKHMQLPHGFEPQLFAAEPDIAKPIAMAWDHRGRLWIAETVDYPNNLQPQGAGHDRIKICEDTDGDGRADKFTVFADKLSIPTSLAFARGGLVVHQAPDTLFLKDTDGDDRADLREVLFTGWNTNDTHAGPSNLRWGFDNWLWGIVGYAGFQGKVGDEEHQFRTGFYRFKPDGTKFEFLRNTNNNSWGVGFSEEGIVFGSTANGNPSVYLPIPNRYYEQVRGWSPQVLGSIATSNDFYPVTDKVRQVDHHGGFTAAAGHAHYTARTYPRWYWNRTAFVTEPTGHLAATFLLEPRGADFVADYGWNLLASDDEWTAPTMAEVGPDGNVWVIDWYNYIVQHNPTPEGFKTGKGAAYETELRDKTHGRIYRLVYKSGEPTTPFQLDPNDARQLVAALSHDNQLWRMHAQRLLVERGQEDVAPQLISLVQRQAVDEIGLNVGAIHALWTLHGLGLLDGRHNDVSDAAIAALRHPSAGVRRNALQVLPRIEKNTAAILAAGCLSDADAQVRLAALLALAESPTSQAAADAITAALHNTTNTQDRWLMDAATSAAAAHAPFFLKAVAADHELPSNQAVAALLNRVAEHYARGGPTDTVASLMVALADANRHTADSILAGLAKGWPKSQTARLDERAESSMAALLAKVSPDAKGQLVNLASRWGSRRFEKYTAEIAAAFLASAQDEMQPDGVRANAAAQLIEFRRNDAAAAEELLQLVTPRTSVELATGLMEAIGRSESREAGAMIVGELARFTPAVRRHALRILLTRADWTAALIEGFEQGQAELSELSLDQKQALAGHPNPAIAERAKALLAKGSGLPDADRQKVIDQLAPLALRTGDAVKGKAVFKQQCAKCHVHSGEGNKIGPDLTGMAVHPKRELLVHVLDPSRSVEGNFRQYTVITGDGRTFNGLLTAETKTAVELVDAEGKRHSLLREDIEELAQSRKSLMPEGFEKQVPPEAIADLLEFLTARGKYLPLDLRKAATIVSTRGMFYSREAQAERLIFPDWSPKTFAGTPFLLVDPQGDRIANVIMLYGPTGRFPPQMPKAVSLPCNAPAKAIHLLSGVSGWGYNGSSVEPTVSMIVRLHYDDGRTEDHPLKNGVHFADYIREVDVPESKLAFKLRGQQIRYLAIYPQRAETIQSIEFVKGPDHTAPVVMAVTVETR
ncbi:MAG TPA: PVC-type heme-binding CxxCH protein [Pirellulales bacterium]|nr:PVC-type heme-binding CxxCH protein [Pirellulales bacterium]